jgi:hypothetical protein
MTKFALLSVAAIVFFTALVDPTLAQQVICDPGYCAQFYPDANCQNTGPNNPYTGDYQRRIAQAASHPANSACRPGMAFYRGHDGRKYACN